MFHWETVTAHFSLSTYRAVLGNPADGRSGISVCIVVHFMKAACKNPLPYSSYTLTVYTTNVHECTTIINCKLIESDLL